MVFLETRIKHAYKEMFGLFRKRIADILELMQRRFESILLRASCGISKSPFHKAKIHGQRLNQNFGVTYYRYEGCTVLAHRVLI